MAILNPAQLLNLTAYFTPTVTIQSIYESLDEFDRLELDGILELYKDYVNKTFNDNIDKRTDYCVIGSKIQFWYNILKNDHTYNYTNQQIKEKLHELDPNLLFFCICSEFEKNVGLVEEEQNDILLKLQLLLHVNFNIA